MTTIELEYEGNRDRVDEIFRCVDDKQPVPGLGYVMKYEVDKVGGRVVFRAWAIRQF